MFWSCFTMLAVVLVSDFFFFQPLRHLFKIPMQRTLPTPCGTSFKITLSCTQPTTPELTWLRSSANGGFLRLAPSNGGVGRHPELVLHVLIQPLHYLLCLIVTQHELWWKGVNWSTYITLRYKEMAKNLSWWLWSEVWWCIPAVWIEQ